MFRNKKYWIALAAWFLVWTPMHTYILIHFGISENTAWQDSLINNLLLASVCFDITFIFRYYRSKKNSWYMLPLFSIGLTVVLLLAMCLALSHLHPQDDPYLLLFKETLPLRFVISFSVIGSFALLDRLLFYMAAQEEENERKINLEKLSRDAELAMLRQQLQPHFLFNTLNSISALIVSKPQEARGMIQQLSDFLRSTIKKDDQKFVDLATEIKQLQLYLDIEKVRFGHRLNTVVEHDEKSLTRLLPPLLLQPLVENAIKFGLYDTTEDVVIRVTAKTENKHLFITIANSFDPETAKPKQGTGFGLSSVQRRLYLLFARNDLLQTQTQGNVFTVTVKIPQSV